MLYGVYAYCSTVCMWYGMVRYGKVWYKVWPVQWDIPITTTINTPSTTEKITYGASRAGAGRECTGDMCPVMFLRKVLLTTYSAKFTFCQCIVSQQSLLSIAMADKQE